MFTFRYFRGTARFPNHMLPSSKAKFSRKFTNDLKFFFSSRAPLHSPDEDSPISLSNQIVIIILQRRGPSARVEGLTPRIVFVI